jgi:hypothetical protein
MHFLAEILAGGTGTFGKLAEILAGRYMGDKDVSDFLLYGHER